MRAYWDGKRLISRQGNAFQPPPGYTAHFPPYPLDGELYSGRSQFEQISAAVRTQNGDWKTSACTFSTFPKRKAISTSGWLCFQAG